MGHRDVSQWLQAARSVVPGVPAFGLPSGLSADGGVSASIAILDSGIDWTLPFFVGARIEARDFTGSGWLIDASGHGTRNASVLVGQSVGGFRGLLPRCQLLVGKVLGGPDRGSTEMAIAQGVRWAFGQGADVIVLPFGSGRSSRRITREIERALGAGVRVVAAAGNSAGGAMGFPARLDGVVAASVLGDDGRPDPGYCVSDDVDVYAPATRVPAMGPDGPTDLSGTSVASVLVAGGGALLASAGRSGPAGTRGAAHD